MRINDPLAHYMSEHLRNTGDPLYGHILADRLEELGHVDHAEVIHSALDHGRYYHSQHSSRDPGHLDHWMDYPVSEDGSVPVWPSRQSLFSATKVTFGNHHFVAPPAEDQAELLSHPRWTGPPLKMSRPISVTDIAPNLFEPHAQPDMPRNQDQVRKHIDAKVSELRGGDNPTTPEDKLLAISHGFDKDLGHVFQHNPQSLHWYTSDTDLLRHGMKLRYGALSPSTWGHGSFSPAETAMLTVLAATSNGTNPVLNTKLARDVLDHAHLNAAEKGSEDWVAHMDPRRVRQHAEFLATHPDTTKMTGGLEDPHKLRKWIVRNLFQEGQLIDHPVEAFHGAAAKVVNNPGSEHHGAAAIVNPGAKKPLYPYGPSFATEMADHLGKPVRVPTDRKLGPAGYGPRGTSVEGSLERIKKVYGHFVSKHGVEEGYRKAQQWLLSKHPKSEVAKLSGDTITPSVFPVKDKIPGTFFIGPKTGPFAWNLHSALSPHLGEPTTQDIWFARHAYTHLGQLSTPGAAEGPKTVTDRRLFHKAAATAAAIRGITPAQAQAGLWWLTQHLYRHLGNPVESKTYADAARDLL